jgi:hypothetical protein
VLWQGVPAIAAPCSFVLVLRQALMFG